MDILHRLFMKASSDGVLQRLQPQEVRFQCSLYADDVILFIRPTTDTPGGNSSETNPTNIRSSFRTIMTNLAKCSITPIYGGEESIDEIVSILGCQV